MKFCLTIIIFIATFTATLLGQVPEWAKGIVWYQIFPERFANGDQTNDPEAEKVFINSDSIPAGWSVKDWTSNWFAQDEWEKKSGGNLRDHIYERRYGGDLQGIIDHLDYLKELGVGGIYLNPIFEAASLHKYDGSTFHHIDVNFGPDPDGDRRIINLENPNDPSTWMWTEADKLFLHLVYEVHKRGMKIIIDGVFNHTGVQFWAFKDIVLKGEESEYKDWYRVEQFDDKSTPQNEFEYKGWWDVKSLPEFNKDKSDLHKGPKAYVFNSTQRWMDPDNDGDPSDGIDGWRLDVAKELPLGFWKNWRKLVKSINKDALIVGELWELSPDFVSKDGPFDALMNYNFAFAVNNYFIADETAVSTNNFLNTLEEVDKSYPPDNLLCLQNLMSSHDTERLSSMIKNPDRQYEHDAHEGNRNYNPGKPTREDYEKQKLIAAFQMTYRGAPMIYYGDEVGMWGADDPHDRKPMIWSELIYDDEVIDESSGFGTGYGTYKVEQEKELLDYYKELISIRNTNSALKTGSLKFIYSSETDKAFAFERTTESQKILIGFNLDKHPVTFEFMPDKRKFHYEELLGEENGITFNLMDKTNITVTLDPISVRIFKFTYADD